MVFFCAAQETIKQTKNRINAHQVPIQTKVSSKSNPSKVAGAIANIYRENKCVEIQTIGAGSLNQAIKAIAIARGFVAPSGENLVVIPAFSDIIINGEQKTAIKLIVENK